MIPGEADKEINFDRGTCYIKDDDDEVLYNAELTRLEKGEFFTKGYFGIFEEETSIGGYLRKTLSNDFGWEAEKTDPLPLERLEICLFSDNGGASYSLNAAYVGSKSVLICIEMKIETDEAVDFFPDREKEILQVMP